MDKNTAGTCKQFYLLSQLSLVLNTITCRVMPRNCYENVYIIPSPYIRVEKFIYVKVETSSNLRAMLRMRVNCRESYREYLATMVRRESNSWRVDSLRLRCDQRAGKTSHSMKLSLPRTSELLLILRERIRRRSISIL
jgi:hypothetical protein